MATYLRPKRGKRATAVQNNIWLKEGEVFFELPTAGEGKGQGRLMMGNGSDAYEDLDAFLAFDMNNVQTFSNITSSNSTLTVNNIINSIHPASPLAHNLNRIKSALLTLNGRITSASNSTTLCTGSSKTATEYSLSYGISTFRYICMKLYPYGTSGQSYETVLLPSAALIQSTERVYVMYDANHNGGVTYVSDTSLKIYVSNFNDRLIVYGIDRAIY